MKNIAVFYGGVSVEREVSVITGVLTLNSLDKERFNPVPVYVDESGEWFTGEYLFSPDNYARFEGKKAKRVILKPSENILYEVCGKRLKPLFQIACAVNCMHGERGEDGSLAGLLRLCDIPLASPPELPSSISMDKRVSKIALKGLGIKTLPCLTVSCAEELKGFDGEFPVIVKPTCGGSSIGVRVAKNSGELESAALYALRFGETAIVEPCLSGFTEINCAAYLGENGVVVSECERPFGKTEVLSFSDKYENGDRQFPAVIPEKLAKRIKETTKKVYLELGFSGIIRIDYFIYKDVVYLNEINSVPGSLAYYLFCDTLKQFTALLTELIGVTLKRHAALSTVQKSFSSGILTAVGSKGAKRL